jgi:Copper amine oxidase N-terminal domain
MLKRFICGAVMVAALCGTGVAPAQADELYIRNRPFKDTYFIAGTTYVPVDGFLKAVKLPWSFDGSTVTVGTGSSPELTQSSETVVLVSNGQSSEIIGVLRSGRLYVPAKDIAKATGYGVIYNSDTGVVDVVKARFTNEADQQAATDVVAARQAEKEKRDAAWNARVEKARAAKKAKAEAEDATADDEEPDDAAADDKGSTDSTTTASGKTGDLEKGASDTAADKIDGKEDNALDMADKSSDVDPSDDKKPAPKADLVVLSADANPDNYSGKVVITAVLQNQGYASATNVRAQLTVTGPDGKEWINKTLYRGPIKADERWTITENYAHRLRSAIPRGDYNVQVVPSFESAAPK